MKSTTFALTLLTTSLSTAIPVTPLVDDPGNGPFILKALASGQPIDGLRISAKNGYFLIGSSYTTSDAPTVTCGDASAAQCAQYPGNETAFYYSSSAGGTVSLDVAVTGGQSLYVDPNTFNLRYTLPGTAPPTAASGQNFTLRAYADINVPGSTPVLGHLPGADESTYPGGGFVACPASNAEAPYTVFAYNPASPPQVPCFSFLAQTHEYTGASPAAYEYTASS